MRTVPLVPGFRQREPTAAQRRRLKAALSSIDEAHRRWALLAREIGYSATAREMGLTPEAIRKRCLKTLGPPR